MHLVIHSFSRFTIGLAVHYELVIENKNRRKAQFLLKDT